MNAPWTRRPMKNSIFWRENASAFVSAPLFIPRSIHEPLKTSRCRYDVLGSENECDTAGESSRKKSAQMKELEVRFQSSVTSSINVRRLQDYSTANDLFPPRLDVGKAIVFALRYMLAFGAAAPSWPNFICLQSEKMSEFAQNFQLIFRHEIKRNV